MAEFRQMRVKTKLTLSCSSPILSRHAKEQSNFNRRSTYPSVSAIVSCTTASETNRQRSIFRQCTKAQGTGAGCDVTNCGRDGRRTGQVPLAVATTIRELLPQTFVAPKCALCGDNFRFASAQSGGSMAATKTSLQRQTKQDSS